MDLRFPVCCMLCHVDTGMGMHDLIYTNWHLILCSRRVCRAVFCVCAFLAVLVSSIIGFRLFEVYSRLHIPEFAIVAHYL